MRVTSNPSCQLISVRLRGGNANHDLFCRLRGGGELEAVRVGEDEGCHETRSFVAVDKRMVANDMVELRCGHGDEIRMEILSAELLLKRQHGRLQQRQVAHAVTAALRLDRALVEIQDVVDAEKHRGVGHPARFFSALPYRRRIFFSEASISSFAIPTCTGSRPWCWP